MKDASKAIQTAGLTRMDSRMVDVMETLKGCLMVAWRAQSSAFEMVDRTANETYKKGEVNM